MLRVARPNDIKPKLVLNTVGIVKRPEIAVNDFAKSVELTPVAVINFDAKLFGTAANNGQMLGEVEPGNKVNESLANLARLLTGRVDARKSKKNPLLEPWMAMLARKRAS